MDYYTRKLKAINKIDEMVTLGSDDDDIIFSIETKFALGEKFVLSRIRHLNKKIEKLKAEGEK